MGFQLKFSQKNVFYWNLAFYWWFLLNYGFCVSLFLFSQERRGGKHWKLKIFGFQKPEPLFCFISQLLWKNSKIFMEFFSETIFCSRFLRSKTSSSKRDCPFFLVWVTILNSRFVGSHHLAAVSSSKATVSCAWSSHGSVLCRNHLWRLRCDHKGLSAALRRWREGRIWKYKTND